MTTSIEWTWCPDGKGGQKKGETWNVQVGCREVSPACKKCYAAKLAHRGMSPQHKGLTVVRADGPHWNGKINRVPGMLDRPFHWRKPRGVFVGSMTDTFYDVSTDEACNWIAALFGVMAMTSDHTYMLLTKRPENAAKWFAWLDGKVKVAKHKSPHDYLIAEALRALDEAGSGWAGAVRHVLTDIRAGVEHPADADAFKTWPLKNVWLGVTAEDQKLADERIPILLKLPAAVRFLSCEPLQESINLTSWLAQQITGTSFAHGVTGDRRGGYLDLSTKPRHTYAPRVDWVITGGESGPGARPMHPDWARSIRDQCVAAGIPYHFKQWGEWAEAGDDWTHAIFDDEGDIWNRSEVFQECGEDDPSRLPGAEGSVAAKIRRVGKAAAGRELDGRTWDEFPEVAR